MQFFRTGPQYILICRVDEHIWHYVLNDYEDLVNIAHVQY